MEDFLDNKIIADDCEKLFKHDIPWNDLNGKSIFITGAYGMLASYMTYMLIFLNEKKNFNINIIVAVRNEEKLISRFGNYVKRDYFHIYKKSINEPIDKNLSADYIVHAASLASPQFYGKIPVDVIVPNIIGTYHLLEHARQNSNCRFLFFSSGSVYGKMVESTTASESTIGILNYFEPGNCYGEAKRCGELLALSYFRQYAVNTMSVRIHHTYGATMDYQNDIRAFSEFVKRAISRQNIEIKSDGTAKRCFCYISDACDAFFRVLVCGAAGEVYNLANTNEYVSIKQLAETIADLANVKVIFKPRDISEEYTPSPVVRTATIDINKLAALGWSPKVNIKNGFDRTIKGIVDEQ